MTPLKINGTTHKIPSISELNTEMFCELHELNDFTIIDYLSIVLKINYKVARDFRIKNPVFLSSQLFGTIPDYESVKPKKFIVVKGRRYNLNENFTLGQRFIIEENGKGKSAIELILFILAVNADQDNYFDLLENIQKEPASQMLPEAFFLLRNLSNGKNLGQRFLRIFKRLTKIRN